MSSISLPAVLVSVALISSGCADDPVDLGLTTAAGPVESVPGEPTTSAGARTPVALPDLSLPAWNGHEAALSWTFDDGFDSHVEVIAPMFADAGIDVTFFPTCSRVLFDPEGWSDVVALGHEVANHTMTHEAAGPETDLDEIAGCDTVIEDVLGIESSTFAYPDGVVDDPYYSYSQSTHVAARGTRPPGQPVRATGTFDWYALPGIGLGTDTPLVGSDAESMEVPLAEIASVVEQRGWLTLIIHAVDEPGYARISVDELQTVVDAAAAADIWQATFADVSTHLRMQQIFRALSPEPIGGGWAYSWDPVHGMTDVGIRVSVAAGHLEQNGVAVPVEDGFALIDARVGAFDWFES